MRNRCGRQRNNRRNVKNFNTNSNNNTNITNRGFNRIRATPRQINGYQYVGACRSGVGPNAYYKRLKDNKIVNYSEINQKVDNKVENRRTTKKLETIKEKNDSVNFCINCGSELHPDAYYCSECGAYQGDNNYTKQDVIKNLKAKIRDIKYKIKEVKKKG
jgi:hypothetical protein